jgi:hypothetical protein
MFSLGLDALQRKRTRVGWFVALGVIATAVLTFAFSDAVRFVVLSIAGIFLFGNPSESDRAAAQRLADAIISVHHFTENSSSQPGRAPVFWTPSSKALLTQPATFQIYDIRDHAEQDQVIQAVKEAIASSHVPAVELQFLDQEHWISTRTSGERGPETLLRRVRITNSKSRDDTRQELITYPKP